MRLTGEGIWGWPAFKPALLSALTAARGNAWREESHMIGSLGNGQAIQTGEVLRADGSGGIHGLWRDRVLYPPRGAQ
jgi:hypothetical protein